MADSWQHGTGRAKSSSLFVMYIENVHQFGIFGFDQKLSTVYLKIAIPMEKMMLNPRILSYPFPESSDMGLLLQVAVDLVISSQDSQEKQSCESPGSFQFNQINSIPLSSSSIKFPPVSLRCFSPSKRARRL